MQRALACALLLLAAASTAAAEARPRLVCPDACADDDGHAPHPCGADCGACTCCVALHIAAPAPALALLRLTPTQVRPGFAEPTPLISHEDSAIFRVPKSLLA